MPNRTNNYWRTVQSRTDSPKCTWRHLSVCCSRRASFSAKRCGGRERGQTRIFAPEGWANSRPTKRLRFGLYLALVWPQFGLDLAFFWHEDQEADLRPVFWPNWGQIEAIAPAHQRPVTAASVGPKTKTKKRLTLGQHLFCVGRLPLPDAKDARPKCESQEQAILTICFHMQLPEEVNLPGDPCRTARPNHHCNNSLSGGSSSHFCPSPEPSYLTSVAIPPFFAFLGVVRQNQALSGKIRPSHADSSLQVNAPGTQSNRQKNPRAHKNKTGTSPPKKEPKYHPSHPKNEEFHGHWGFLAERANKSQAPVTLAQPLLP